jgi:hypothetical protein
MSLNFRCLNQKNDYESRSASSFLCVLAYIGDRGIGLSFRTPSRNRSNYRSILCLYPDCLLRRDRSPSQHQVSSKKYAFSLPAAIGALGSPLGPCPKRDLATDIYSGSIPIVHYDESISRISFKQLQGIYNVVARCNQGVVLSFENSSKNSYRCRSILWLYPVSQLRQDRSTRSEQPF